MHTLLTDLFIVTYIVFAWLWVLPKSSPFTLLLKPFRKYIKWTGLWHSWNMFLPNPSRSNKYFQAEITFASGAVCVWFAPRLCQLDRLHAFLQKRHRKYHLNVLRNQHTFIRPALCDYLIRKFHSPNDPPTKVKLLYFHQEVLPPGIRDPKIAIFKKVVLFIYQTNLETPDDSRDNY